MAEQASNFPIKLSNPARRALEHARLMKIEDLTKITEREFRELHGVGPSTVEPMKVAMKERNLSFMAS